MFRTFLLFVSLALLGLLFVIFSPIIILFFYMANKEENRIMQYIYN